MQDAQKPKTSLKKKILIGIGIILVIGAIANSNKSNQPKIVGTNQQSPETKEETEDKTPTSFKIGDIINYENYTVTVKEMADCVGTLKAQEGNKYIIFDVLQENSSDQEANYNLLNFKAQDQKDFVYNPTFFGCKNPSFTSGVLEKGQKSRGYVTFEVPKDSTITTLIYKPNVWASKEIHVLTK